MLIIASNLTTRDRKIASMLKTATQAKDSSMVKGTMEFLGSLARECVAAGANVIDINVQQHHDTPAIVEMAVNAVQGATNCQLCLSCHSLEALEASLNACRRPPIVNYVSLDTQRLERILPLAARHQAEVVLLTADPMPPETIEDTLKSAAVLVGAANEAGVPNSRIFIDPGVLHVTYSVGQRHSQTLIELIPALAEAFDPPVRTTCWVDNVSAGAGARVRPFVNSGFFAFLAGLGLSSAFVDVLEGQMARTIRLMRIFSNELIYSDGEISKRT
ncbi:MAG: dihydropteroate synthase [Chloroflexi bacterium]|nr:dihydropteroate synthase [Chloroflexota bacterium]